MEARMNDILFIGLTILFFVLSVWLIDLLDGLQEGKS
jgi:hypothetical protein